MQRFFCKYGRVFFFTSLFFLLNNSYVYSGSLKEEAGSYREKGYIAQESGDIDTAISWYQKAAEMDPKYATPHNDLGILFEAKGWLDRAESEYLKALAIDGDYEKAHTNLALLYERRGELEKAAFHWMRRYKLGKPGGPWTKEARERLEKLGLIGEKRDTEKAAEEKVVGQEEAEKDYPEEEFNKKWLGEERYKKRQKSPKIEPQGKKAKEKRELSKSEKKTHRVKPSLKDKQVKEGSKWTRIGRDAMSKADTFKSGHVESEKGRSGPALEEKLQKALTLAEERLRAGKKRSDSLEGVPAELKPSSNAKVNKSYSEAKAYYNKGEYSRGLDVIRAAKRTNPEEKILLDMELEIKNKMKEERIDDYYAEGMMLYRKKDFSGARKEFEAILNILPE